MGYKHCRFCENCARDTPLWGVYIPHFDQISVKISVLGVLYPYRCTDGCEIWHGGLLPEVSAQPVWQNMANQHSPTMRITPITQSTGKRLRSSTENKTVLPGGSRKLYISARKVIELWIETKAVTSRVMPTTTFLMQQQIVASRLGRTEYQLVLMKISWWDRNVKIISVERSRQN